MTTKDREKTPIASTAGAEKVQQQQQNSQNTLIDVLGDIYNNPSSGVNNAKKYDILLFV